jgi:toxin ParE2
MKITFLEIAQIELDDAIEYYNYEVPGLGDAFLTEVLNALDRIGNFPEAWHPSLTLGQPRGRLLVFEETRV